MRPSTDICVQTKTKSGRDLKAKPETTVSRETRASVAPRAMNSAVVRPSLAPRPARRHAPVATHASHRPASVFPAATVATRSTSLFPAAAVATRSARSKKPRGLDPRISAELLQQYEPLVRKIAGGFQRKLPRNVLREDLIAAGMSGLWDAIRRHPDGPGESFEWYVRVRIRGAILDELRAQDWLPRRARAAAEAASGTDAYIPPPAVVRFDDVSEWEQNRCLADASSSEAAVAAKFAQETLAKAVEQLPERERHIVSQHYFRGVKFKDLGAELGVSEPRISQLHSRAIQRLKVIINSAA
ncbi:MAG TPA: sigma-70 family RNA polymerase sigma factor [Polyangiaceae bacterium]|jgi:RNA polymerase sigma factor for flagellar operon FliA|nr:sigma-70 family RNA polymerase sigma factor [Polyangiaceae bacterium]